MIEIPLSTIAFELKTIGIDSEYWLSREAKICIAKYWLRASAYDGEGVDLSSHPGVVSVILRVNHVGSVPPV